MAHHESGGLSSLHDVEIFRAWNKSFPEYVWTRAEVDSRYGLTLFVDLRRDEQLSLHFPHAICGFLGGIGPGATVTILQEAGFGDTDTLEALIYRNAAASLTKES